MIQGGIFLVISYEAYVEPPPPPAPEPEPEEELTEEE